MQQAGSVQLRPQAQPARSWSGLRPLLSKSGIRWGSCRTMYCYPHLAEYVEVEADSGVYQDGRQEDIQEDIWRLDGQPQRQGIGHPPKVDREVHCLANAACMSDGSAVLLRCTLCRVDTKFCMMDSLSGTCLADAVWMREEAASCNDSTLPACCTVCHVHIA